MSKELENILIAKQITPTPMRVMVIEYIAPANAIKAESNTTHFQQFSFMIYFS